MPASKTAKPKPIGNEGLSKLQQILARPVPVERFAIKIMGGEGGRYAWRKQVPVPYPKMWADDGPVVAISEDPAIEIRLGDAVESGTVIPDAYRDPATGEVRFRGA